MKTDVSFIISIDSSFEMLNNFFEHLLQDEFALNSEIIVILDAITNCNLSINSLNFPVFSRLPAIENSIYVSFSLVFALMG